LKIEVEKDILGRNDRVAAENQALFADKKIFVLNLMGSPGSGKTSLLEQTMAALKDKLAMAVIEGDLFTTKDADRIEKYAVPVIQINTAGGCHLDAPMVQKVLPQLDLEQLDLLIVENVGNLVCPAEFAIGEDEKAVVLSITEGDDKPLKYPLMFKESAVAVLNKIDILPYCNFAMASATDDIETLHPGVQVMPVSCTTGEGIKAWCDWLQAKVQAKQQS
jgi:hydrogenase nickel incorporation protein HypB